MYKTPNKSMYVCMYVCMYVRAGGGGEGGAAPPVTEMFEIFQSGKTLIRVKALGRKHPKRLSKPDLKATFSDVCLVRRRSQVKLSKDPGICFGKTIYRLHVYRRNPRDGYCFHQQNNDRIKANEDLDFFVVALRRTVFKGSTTSCFKFFLNFTYEEEFTVS